MFSGVIDSEATGNAGNGISSNGGTVGNTAKNNGGVGIDLRCPASAVEQHGVKQRWRRYRRNRYRL